MEKETIQSYIDYMQSKLDAVDKTIEFYKSVGARVDLTDELALKEEILSTINNMKAELESPADKLPIKVRVTEHNGKVIIETLDQSTFDIDFRPNKFGSIGCTMMDMSRVGISKEAMSFFDRLERVRDGIGDLMGDDMRFVWIGGPIRIIDESSVVSRDFRKPKGYVEIDNTTSEIAIKANDFIEDIKEHNATRPTAEIWLTWDSYALNDTYAFNASFTRAHVINDSERKKSILDKCKSLFANASKDEVMSRYINPLFDLGFFNNVMNPGEHYWRMSFAGTLDEIESKIDLFKESMTLPA